MILVGLSACYSPVEKTLQVAGTNKSELRSVLHYYEAKQETDKLESARFLIGNMTYHFTVLWNAGQLNKANFVSRLYASKNEVKHVMDSLRITYAFGGIDADAQSIKGNYLKDRIEDAYAVLEKYPWSKKVPQNEFNEYILPYRVAHEELENWWIPIQKMLVPVIDSLGLVSVDSIIGIVDSKMSSEFKYDSRYSYYRSDMNYTDALVHEGGLCNHCADLMTMALRSIGIPVAVDYVPAWGNTSGGHSWNVARINTQYWKPFGFGEYDKEFILAYHPPKVFRRTYSLNKEIHKDLKNVKHLPAFLRFPLFDDVTEMYRPTANVKINNTLLHHDKGLPIISVWNNDDWRAVWYGKKEEDKIMYNNMGINMIYLPQMYTGVGCDAIDYPIYLTKEEELVICQPNDSSLMKINDVFAWKYNWMMCKKNITENRIYELMVWDKGWIKVSQSKPALHVYDKKQEQFKPIKQSSELNVLEAEYVLQFENVPSGGLYKLDEKGQRPFVVKNNQVIYM